MALLPLTTVLSLLLLPNLRCIHCSEFAVGDRTGWVVPPPNNTDLFNAWASKLRFKIGDSLCFTYSKDSVMEVSAEDYKHCNSNRPNFFSNIGNTIFPLNRSGIFYFISGAEGHCDKGQRMIIWVVGQEDLHTEISDAVVSHEQSLSCVVVLLGAMLFLLHVNLLEELSLA